MKYMICPGYWSLRGAACRLPRLRASGIHNATRQPGGQTLSPCAINMITLINSPGLGPGRVRSFAFCVYCNICYVCKLFFTCFVFCCNILCVCLATFAISAIVVVHCLDNCCLLFKKCAHEGGCQGAPGLGHN